VLPRDGGEGGIRTHETRKGSAVFKTAAFNRSATSPNPPSALVYGSFWLTALLAERWSQAICSHLLTRFESLSPSPSSFASTLTASRRNVFDYMRRRRQRYHGRGEESAVAASR
jgi:hypothetical protein